MTRYAVEPQFTPESSMGRLSTAAAVVVGTTRLWAAPHRAPWQSHPDWKTGLHVAGVVPWAIHAFDTMLWIAIAAGTRELDVRCQHCPALGRDEAWMLQMVNHAQFGLRPEALEILQDWMPEGAARAAIHHLNLVGYGLANAGLLVELPAGGARLLPAERPRRPDAPTEPVTLH